MNAAVSVDRGVVIRAGSGAGSLVSDDTSFCKRIDQNGVSFRSPCSGQAERVARGRSGAQEIRL